MAQLPGKVKKFSLYIPQFSLLFQFGKRKINQVERDQNLLQSFSNFSNSLYKFWLKPISNVDQIKYSSDQRWTNGDEHRQSKTCWRACEMPHILTAVEATSHLSPRWVLVTTENVSLRMKSYKKKQSNRQRSSSRWFRAALLQIWPSLFIPAYRRKAWHCRSAWSQLRLQGFMHASSLSLSPETIKNAASWNNCHA